MGQNSMLTNSKYDSDKKFVFYLNLIIVLLSITILRLPIVLGYRYDFFIRGFTSVPLFCVFVMNLYYIRKFKIRLHIDRKLTATLLLFMVIWIVALLRTAFIEINFDTFTAFLILFTYFPLGMYVFSVFHAIPEENQQIKLAKAVVYSFVLYVVLNFVFHWIGISTNDEIYLTRYPAQMLGLLGIKTYRVLFPMADGNNSFGILAGASLVGVIQLLRSRSGNIERIIYILVSLVCLSVIFMTDSRGALIFSVISIFLLFIPKNAFRYLRWSPIFISLIPLMAFTFVPNILSNSTTWLNRPSGENIPVQGIRQDPSCQQSLNNNGGSLSNRPIIWQIILNHLKDFKPSHIFGYGYRGHVVSSISDQYDCLFASYAKSNLASSHNIWLQLILDIGYFGLLITVILFVLLTLILTQSWISNNLAIFPSMLGVLFYIIMIGSLEAPISPDFYGPFIFLILITICSMFFSQIKNVNKPENPHL